MAVREIILIPGEGDPAIVIDRALWDEINGDYSPCPFAQMLLLCDGACGYINRYGHRLWRSWADDHFVDEPLLRDRPVVMLVFDG